MQRKTAGARPIGRGRPRPGLSAAEVVVLLAIVTVVILFLLMALPRQREGARFLQCQANLAQIGIALVYYDQAEGRLPSIPDLSDARSIEGAGPLRSLMGGLGITDLRGLTRESPPGKARPGFAPPELDVPGFTCPSDPMASAGTFRTPVSYRATAGTAPNGGDGAFAPGGSRSLADIEAADGTGYTAAFSERLVGTGEDAREDPRNYAVVPGPIIEGQAPPKEPAAWRGDAGSSWADADWASTLYNHALNPGAGPSMVADDRRTALMGASSGHVERVNVLFFDLSVRDYLVKVDPTIWRALADVQSPAPPADAAPAPTPAPPASDAPGAPIPKPAP